MGLIAHLGLSQSAGLQRRQIASASDASEIN